MGSCYSLRIGTTGIAKCYVWSARRSDRPTGCLLLGERRVQKNIPSQGRIFMANLLPRIQFPARGE